MKNWFEDEVLFPLEMESATLEELVEQFKDIEGVVCETHFQIPLSLSAYVNDKGKLAYDDNELWQFSDELRHIVKKSKPEKREWICVGCGERLENFVPNNLDKAEQELLKKEENN